MKLIKAHKFLATIGAVVILFFATKFGYIDKRDVRRGFHSAVGIVGEIREFWHDVTLSDSEDKVLHTLEEKADSLKNIKRN